MINVQTNIDLKPYLTMQTPAIASFFAIADTIDILKKLLTFATSQKLEVFILGEGSNTIFTRNFPGLVIKNELAGIKVIEGSDSQILLQVAAGENWHNLVTFCVEHGWSGIENLALIPGTTGAAPVQNIAAYGQNFSDVFEQLEAIDIFTKEIVHLNKDSCQFGYRDSIFKHQFKGKFVVTNVTLKLYKKAKLETSYYSIGGRYDSLESELSQIAAPPYNIKDVYQAVINIRSRKLLDPAVAPTIGSYFINPIVPVSQLKQLTQQIKNLQYYPVENLNYHKLNQEKLNPSDYIKLPAGRLIDELGWRGRQIGNCIVSEKLASIITHNGEATGQEIIDFANQIKQDVKNHYQVDLSTEVNII